MVTSTLTNGKKGNGMKTLLILFFFSILSFSVHAQNFVPKDEAINNLLPQLSAAKLTIKNKTEQDYPEYQKAYTKKQVISRIILKLKKGSTVEQAYKAAVPTISFNVVQKSLYLVPDENGKLSYQWVEDEILPLITK